MWYVVCVNDYYVYLSFLSRELVISALKASGSGACIKVLLQKIREGRISPIETANIFVSMMSNVANPAIISDLIVSSKRVIALP